MADSACTSCGACCACFRVDFSVYEMDFEGGSVPSGLANEGAALADVAHQLGFADQAHFQRQFKKRHATTPKNYQGDQRPISRHG